MMVFMAGITGMGTQAMFGVLRDIALDPAPLQKDAIGCIAAPSVRKGLKDTSDVSDYYRKWRISEYQILHQIDRNGRSLKVRRVTLDVCGYRVSVVTARPLATEATETTEIEGGPVTVRPFAGSASRRPTRGGRARLRAAVERPHLRGPCGGRW